MSKTIWMLNHYAEIGSGRHYKFAQNLSKKGYNVKIFAASSVHNRTNNKIKGSIKYIEEKRADFSFIYIKARNYSGNGKQRILNMIDYATGLMFVSKKFDQERPDVILASSVHPLTWIAGYRLAKRYDAKFIVETRDLWPETLVAMGQITKKSVPAKILYKIEKHVYKKADSMIFTFPGGKDYVESIGLDNSKVRYINNGIDLGEFNFNKVNNEFEDEDLDNPTTYKILYTGSMGQANELMYLIKAAQLIKQENIGNFKFILFGTGYQRENLEKYVKDNNIDNVIFKGSVERKYIPNILSKADLNVFTGKNIYLYKYGLSLNKMFDYFGSGKPTLSNIECGYDILQEYNCGITVEGGSVEELKEGILKFYNMHREEYDIYCKNALKAAGDFDFKILTDRLENIILELEYDNERQAHANSIN